MKKKVLSILFIGILTLTITGCGSDKESNSNSNNNSNNNYNNSSNNKYENNTSNSTTSTKNKKYTLGDTIVFDGLEITFDSNYSFVSVDNSYSEYNGQPIIKIGVNVKNVSQEKNHLNMFFYDLFGSNGTELDSVTAYFDEDSIDFAGELKPGASYTAYFYIIYDGDGEYSIDFDNYSEELSVEFNIVKQ